MDVYARDGQLPELREVNGSLDEGVRALLRDVPNVPPFSGFYRTLQRKVNEPTLHRKVNEPTLHRKVNEPTPR